MSWKAFPLFLLMAVAALMVAGAADHGSAAQTAPVPIPIVSSSPWTEVDGTIVNGESVQFSFSGQAGQVASIDAFMPVTLTMKGEVRLLQALTGTTFNDEVYGRSWVWYNQQSHWDEVGIAAVLPETGDYLIEVVPNSAYTATFSLRFNLIDPASFIEVDDDLAQCPSAPTGIVRGAVRAIAAGGTVSVCEGTYLETTEIIVAQPNITVHGAGADLTRISGDDSSTLQIGTRDTVIDARNATIRDLTLENRQSPQPAVQLFENSHGLTVQDSVFDTACAVPHGIQSTTIGAQYCHPTQCGGHFSLPRLRI